MHTVCSTLILIVTGKQRIHKNSDQNYNIVKINMEIKHNTTMFCIYAYDSLFYQTIAMKYQFFILYSMNSLLYIL